MFAANGRISNNFENYTLGNQSFDEYTLLDRGLSYNEAKLERQVPGIKKRSS